jgi:hypothetical protein
MLTLHCARISDYATTASSDSEIARNEGNRQGNEGEFGVHESLEVIQVLVKKISHECKDCYSYRQLAIGLIPTPE